jgi:hypothetical protein
MGKLRNKHWRENEKHGCEAVLGAALFVAAAAAAFTVGEAAVAEGTDPFANAPGVSANQRRKVRC